MLAQRSQWSQSERTESDSVLSGGMSQFTILPAMSASLKIGWAAAMRWLTLIGVTDEVVHGNRQLIKERQYDCTLVCAEIPVDVFDRA